MHTFLEFVFADLNPQKNQWTHIPRKGLEASQHLPPENIDTELFKLLDKTYHYIGGHVDFAKPSDLPANHTIWYATDTDGDKKPDAVEFGKSTPYGTKWTGLASDGSPAAKTAMLDRMATHLKTKGNYCEMSDAILHVMLTRYGVPSVDDKKKVEQIINKPIEWLGVHPEGKYPEHKGFYRRSLGGSMHLKMLCGKI